jgi:hypothetical protein
VSQNSATAEKPNQAALPPIAFGVVHACAKTQTRVCYGWPGAHRSLTSAYRPRSLDQENGSPQAIARDCSKTRRRFPQIRNSAETGS